MSAIDPLRSQVVLLYFPLEINAAPSPAPKLEVRFQALPSGDSGTAKELTMTATQVPVLASTPQGIPFSCTDQNFNM